MDLKGIKWAGNIYQKFETMCLEVEEVMYEDTVKYVENQVQKVGASVKKFYSEVMQDMLPPSCVDPVKVADGNLSLNPYAHTDINKKPKLDGQKEFKEKDTKDEEFSGLTSGKQSCLTNDVDRLSPPSSRVLVENTFSDLCSGKTKKVGIQKRPIGIKRISHNSRPSKVSCPMSSLSGDKSIQPQKSSLVVGRHNPGEAVNENTPISTLSAPVEFPASEKSLSAEPVRETKDDTESTSDKFLSAEYGRQKIDNSKCAPPASNKTLSVDCEREKIDDFECASPSSDKIVSAEYARQKKDDSECTSSGRSMPSEYIGPPPVNNISFSHSGSSFGGNAHEVESRGKKVMIHNEGTHGSFPQLNTWDFDSAGEEFSMFHEENFDMEVIENEVEQRVEIFKPVKRSTLEETCILVEGDELHSFQGIEKQKSYKKKICNALSSKLRSTKKQNPHFKDLEGKKDTGSTIPTPSQMMDSREVKVRERDSFDSDWELL